MRLLVIMVLVALPFAAHADEASAIRAVRSAPRAIDAMTDQAGNMYVSVKAGKGDWDGYAVQLCKMVQPHRARIFRIRVVDAGSVTAGRKPPDWTKLGEARCG